MQRDERFSFVLTQSEKAAIIRLADVEGGLSRAALIRRLIRKAAHERGIWADFRDYKTQIVSTKLENDS